MDTCRIRRCRWPLLAFINAQVCFKKWELWVSSVFLSSGCCNFQPLKACQANSEDKYTTLNYNMGLQGPSQHFTPVSSWTHIPSREGGQCEDRFGQMTKFGTMQDQSWDNILGRPNLIYDELEKLKTNIVPKTLLPCLNTPSRWFTIACISQILLKSPFMADVNCP